MGQTSIPRMISQLLVVAIIITALMLQGCVPDAAVKTTDPLKNVITQETILPVGACPKQVDELVYPARPALAIDTLTSADHNNYQKVGQAYQQTIADLQLYASQLEDVAYGIKDICKTVNTNNIGK